MESPMNNQSMPNIQGSYNSFGQPDSMKNAISQVLPGHHNRRGLRNKAVHIKTFSQAAVKQLFVPASPINFRQQQQSNNSSISSFTESRLQRPEGMVLPKFLPAIVSPQASKIDMGGTSPFNGSRRFLKNSRNDLSMRMDSLNDKGIYKGLSTDSFSTERVFQYQPQQVKQSLIMPEAQTAHDKLNLMIIRG